MGHGARFAVAQGHPRGPRTSSLKKQVGLFIGHSSKLFRFLENRVLSNLH